jgi:hypothetical protein
MLECNCRVEYLDDFTAKNPMRKREFDARVGYFANEYGV